jgi:N-acetylmuramoyl-L-alanine amidase CwlA
MQLDQAFRDLNIVQDFIPVTNSNRPGTRLVPTHITIHNTDNANLGADAAAHARYMKGADAQARQVSWHYTVDDRIIYQSLPVNEVGWHAKQGNSKSIGIEICMHQGMNEAKAYDRAALLVAVLALQNGIPVPSRIVQHYFWTEKHCPRVLRDKPNGWSDFLAKVQAALTQLRSAPKVAPQTVTHVAGYDACEVLNSSAPKGAARTTATAKRKTKAKSKTKAKTKPKSRSKTRRTKTRKRPRKS